MQQGDLLYRLERAPFEAAVQQQEAAVADASARLANANIQLARAQSLLATPAGQRSNVDDAIANQRSLAAQVLSAQAQLRQAQINLAYTEIRAPVAGKISRTNITAGNVVSPEFRAAGDDRQPGPDVCDVPGRVPLLTDLQKRYADKGGTERGRGQAATAGRRRYTTRPARSITSSRPSPRRPTRSWCARDRQPAAAAQPQAGQRGRTRR